MSLAALVAGSPLVSAQRDPRPLGDHRRMPGFAEMTSIFDFEPVFHGNVPQSVYDYTAHGADSEFTIGRNRDAFDWVDVVPRAPIDPAAVDTRTIVLGLNLDESRAMLDPVHGTRSWYEWRYLEQIRPFIAGPMLVKARHRPTPVSCRRRAGHRARRLGRTGAGAA